MGGSIALRRIAVAALAAAAFALAACGDDDSTDATEAATSAETTAETVDVTAIEYEFDVTPTPTAETETVNFINEGEEFHVLVFARLNEGFTVDEAVKLEGKKGSAELIGQTEAEPGKTGTIEVKKPIEPGDYVMLCPISGPEGPHYKLGQLAEFAIE
ncbi:MAG TPA: hypothetical protein VFH44_07745 [Solirubrobacterales bacterium]|nr:hypothetical protein [Solirubrobacterales bacterium]